MKKKKKILLIVAKTEIIKLAKLLSYRKYGVSTFRFSSSAIKTNKNKPTYNNTAKTQKKEEATKRLKLQYAQNYLKHKIKE